MRIIEPYQLYDTRYKRRRGARKRFILLITLLFIGALSVYTAYIVYRPYPPLHPALLANAAPSSLPVNIAWPAYGQSAIGALGYGVLESSPADKPAPMASIAKVMTALTVLKKYPLALNQQGPMITITPADIELYRSYLAKNGTVVNVVVGEQISQYQALQAVLIASANNMADTLAIWAFGSMNEYTKQANVLAKELGLRQSHFADDASGFSPNNTGTAEDLVRLGLAAMQEPVIAQIVSQPKASIPNSAEIQTTNQLLGQHGIVGIKTGNTDQAGDCYLFAANRAIGSGQKVTLVGVIMGGPTFTAVYNDAPQLLNNAYQGFIAKTVIRSGEVVAEYRPPWAQAVSAVAVADLNALYWQADSPAPKLTLDTLEAPVGADQLVGTASAVNGTSRTTTPLIIKGSIPAPGFWWRLTHPF